MSLHVWILAASGVARLRKTFCIRFEGLSSREQVAHDVVARNGAAEAILIGDDLTGRQHEVVANRRMRICIVLRGQAVFICQAVQVRH